MLTSSDHRLELREAGRLDPVTIVTPLRYRGRVLAEALGRDGFDEVARYGDATHEAVVLRGHGDNTFYALAATPAHRPRSGVFGRHSGNP